MRAPHTRITRRQALTRGAAAVVGAGAAGMASTATDAAQAQAGAAPAAAPAQQGGAPGIVGRATDRPFRALVRHGTTATIETLRLLPRRPEDVVVRTQATATCYTIVGGVLSTRPAPRPSIPNHSGFGVVEEVGPLVTRVKVGDRVIVCGTPQCGQCYQCLQGRSDWCQFLTVDNHPIAQMADGTPVGEAGQLGGLSEVMVVTEQYCCPVFTDLPADQLSLLGDTVGTGLAAGMNLAPIQRGWDVVVLGCGPVGLGGVMSARVMDAGQIIAVEPIRVRRDLALKLGATTVLDPNAEGGGLVARIRSLCKGRTDRVLAGGRVWNANDVNVPMGADLTIEACGGDALPPRAEVSPDPTGILPLRQAWELTRAGGHVVYLGFGQRGDVSFPGLSLANRGRTLHSGQQGGMNMLRDLPRYVSLMERGVIDVGQVITARYPLERSLEAVRAVADRTTVAAVVTFA